MLWSIYCTSLLVRTCDKRDLMMLMICHVVNILSSMMVTTMMMKQWIGFSVAPCIKLYK